MRDLKSWPLLVTLLAGAAAMPVAAGTPAKRLVFRHLTVADGLSNGYVRALYQDRRGFLWIGTADGLNRYDAYGFRVFRHDPEDPRSVGPGTATAVEEDGDGQLWVGLQEGGVSRFDPRSETFTSFRHDPADPRSLSSDSVNALAIGSDGNVWVGTMDGGLNRLDPRTGQVARYRHDPRDGESLAPDEVTAIVRDRSGVLWVGTGGGGLARIVGTRPDGRPRFQHFRHDPADARSLSSDDVRSLLEGADGSLWVGTWEAGLNRLDPERTSFRRYVGDTGRSAGGGDHIFALREDHTGAVWFASAGYGLRRLDPATGRGERFAANPSDPSGLSHPDTTSLLEDRSGLLWIATGGGGLNVVDLKAKPFARYPASGDPPGGLMGMDVRSVMVDSAGGIWAGTPGQGLNRIERSSGRVTRFRHHPSDRDSLADDDVRALLQDRQGTIWVGTFGGLDRFDAARRRFVHHRHRAGDSHSLSDDNVYALHEDTAGRLWVGTWQGLDLLDRRTGRFTAYRPPRIKRAAILFIGEDRSGSLWLGIGRQLVRFDPDAGVFDHDAAIDPGEPERLRTLGPTGIRFDANGRGWAGASQGLVELLPAPPRAPRRARVYTHRDGLPQAPIAAVEVTADGRLWLGTSHGLVQFDPRRTAVRHYDSADGVPEACNPGAAFRAPDGEMFFGTTGGLTSFRPEQLVEDLKPPTVVVTGLALSHRPVAIGPASVLRQSVGYSRTIELPHDAPVLTLEFTALSFRAPDRTRFRYRLSGFDREWHELTNGAHSATYTSLAPGGYVFEVRGSSGDGVWSEQAATLGIVIRPPWWGTWWFRGLTLASAAGLLVTTVHRRRRRTAEVGNGPREREVLAREQAQRALARSERQLRLLADALPVVIAYVDAEGRVGFSNLATEAWFHRPRAEMEGRAVEEILPPEIYAQARAPIQAARGGERVEFDVAAGSGAARRRMSATLVPHAEGDGRVLGFYAVVQDITERLRIQEELHRQHDQLAHASRVSTLGEMASALAHELNQPLTALLSNANAALRLYSGTPTRLLSPDIQETLIDIAHDAARAGEIIRRLRDLVRNDDSRKGPLDLNQAIRGIETLIRAAALENDVALSFDLMTDLSPCTGDAIQIQQVVLNLVRNGIEAMYSVPRAERRMVVRSLREKDGVAVSVEDAGPPVAAEVLDRLFTPFYSTKEKGLGMGLSISRSIIQAHGGWIEAYTGRPRGLVVRFTLPAAGGRIQARHSRMSA